MASNALRIGVLRSGTASSDPVVALAEARVVRHELERRLGEVSLDFRADGPAPTPWSDLAHAAWPSDVDAVIELDELLDGGGSRLTSLFARTLDTDAVDVRRRMLTHLGILPLVRVDDDALAERLPTPRRPTDVWIVLHDADEVAVSDPHLRALVDRDGRDDGVAEASKVDEGFDQVVDGLGLDTASTVERLHQRIDELRDQLAEAQSDRVRAERLAAERLDELTAERDILRERLERTLLDAEVS